MSNELSKERAGRVTGSVAGAILGLDPNRSRADVMRAMVREYHGAPKEIDEFAENVIFAYGRFNEEGALIEYQMETGNTVVNPSIEVPHGFFIHPQHDWLGATPDGLVGMHNISGGLVEIKCPYGKRNDKNPIFKSILKDELPHYLAQCQIEMYCSDREWVDFYQWAPTKTKLERVYISEKWLDKNVPLLKAFHGEYLYECEHNYQRHLDPRKEEIDSAKAQMLIAEYDELSDAIDNATDKKKSILAELVRMAKDKNADVCGRSLYKVEKPGAISYANVVKEHCRNIDLEPYRGKSSEYWVLK